MGQTSPHMLFIQITKSESKSVVGSFKNIDYKLYIDILVLHFPTFKTIEATLLVYSIALSTKMLVFLSRSVPDSVSCCPLDTLYEIKQLLLALGNPFCVNKLPQHQTDHRKIRLILFSLNPALVLCRCSRTNPVC